MSVNVKFNVVLKSSVAPNSRDWQFFET